MTPTDDMVLAQLTRIEDKLDQKADKEDVTRLEAKVDYTNGSVRALQLWKAHVQGATLSWRSGGALAVITAACSAAATHFIQ